MEYLVRYACCSHRGLVRKMNQDNVLCDGMYMESPDTLFLSWHGAVSSKQPSLFAVFDGMGGEIKGEVAALLAAKCASTVSIGADPESDLYQYCLNANALICEYAEERGYYNMGTTAAMLAFTANRVTVCNVGDSKILRLKHNKLEQLSIDDCWIAPPNMKAPLLQNLGIPEEEMLIEPHIFGEAVCDRDLYLICTDGLTDLIDNKTIKRIMSETTFGEMLDTLLLLALEKGGVDNISMIICRIETVSEQ